MKKKKLLFIIIPVVVVLLIALGAAAYLLFSGSEFEDGRVVACEDGVFVFVGEDGQFWQMNLRGLASGSAASLKSGDRVTVLRSTAMAMSYPGQCSVKLCFKRADGEVGDIPAGVLGELERIGWYKGLSEIFTPDEDSEFDEASDDVALASLINSVSELEFDILSRKSIEEILEYDVEAADSCYYITVNDEVSLGGGKYKTYQWVYTYSGYFGEGEGLYVTEIETDNPDSVICGVRTGAGLEALKKSYEEKSFEVSIKNNTLVAKRGGITVTYTVYGEDEVALRVSLE